MEHFEEWKDVKGYRGYYQVSNLGNIRRIASRTGKRITPRPIKSVHKKTYGRGQYCQVSFSIYNIKREYMVHRVVAEAFLPAVENKRQVNHKNGDPSDNRAFNLERCTPKENMNHSYHILGNDSVKYLKPWKNKKGALCCNSKAVLQYTLDNIFIREWASMADVGRAGISDKSAVCDCCNGKRNTAGGYIRRHKK